MSNFPSHIQQAVDLGLLQVEDGKIVSCKRDEAETILAVNRVIEKIQPTSAAKADSTIDQEAIVLCRVLSSPSGPARELVDRAACCVRRIPRPERSLQHVVHA